MVDPLMIFRLSLQAIAAVLAYRGIGDGAMWEAVIGAAVSGFGLWLSHRANKAKLAAVPPEVAAELARLRAQVEMVSAPRFGMSPDAVVSQLRGHSP